MKLIKPSVRRQESIYLAPPKTLMDRFKNVFLGFPMRASRIACTYNGRVSFSTCLIDFQDEDQMFDRLGVRIPSLRFGNHVYHGVVPINIQCGTTLTIFECSIEHIEIIQGEDNVIALDTRRY